MNIIEVPAKLLLSLGLPENAIYKRIIPTPDFSLDPYDTPLFLEMVFEYNGKFFRTTSPIPSGGDNPWGWERTVTCVEVEKVQRTVECWAPVKESIEKLGEVATEP
jgi:hypothetical protein